MNILRLIYILIFTLLLAQANISWAGCNPCVCGDPSRGIPPHSCGPVTPTSSSSQSENPVPPIWAPGTQSGRPIGGANTTKL